MKARAEAETSTIITKRLFLLKNFILNYWNYFQNCLCLLSQCHNVHFQLAFVITILIKCQLVIYPQQMKINRINLYILSEADLSTQIIFVYYRMMSTIN